MQPLLEVTNLAVSYGGIRAIEDVSLAVAPGEIVALVGANGAGKSSLLKAVAGIVKPASGGIRFDGHAIDSWPAHRILPLGIAYVPEGRLIVGTLSVRDNLRLGAYARGGRESATGVFERVLQRFPVLAARLDDAGASLSGGQAQMLALARGLMAVPRLLLLDEPALGLSPRYADEVWALIASLRAEGITALLVEQNVAKSLALADRAYVMEGGRIVKQGAASLLARDPGLREAYLGIRSQVTP
jgi:branched-chain amino acid transport system ATP-binding protein